MKADLVVFDSNVLISAALNALGKPAQALEYVYRRGQPLLSVQTFDEVRNRLMLPRFDRYVSVDQRRNFLESLYVIAAWTRIDGGLRCCADRDDDMFLETAFNGGADCIVSGDKDLLALHPFRGIPILSPAEFVAEFGL